MKRKWNEFCIGGYKNSDFQYFNTAWTLGGAIGSFIGGNLSDIIGRRAVFFLADIVIIIASILFFLGAKENLYRLTHKTGFDK